MCLEGHQSGSAGCSRCAQGLGRSLRDPFQCQPCGGSRWRQVLSHAAPQVGVFLMALRSSYAEKTQVGSVVKIMVAFGTTASMTLRALLRSEDVMEARRRLLGTINTAIFSMEVASGGGGGSGSLDCLLTRDSGAADLASWRAGMLAVPISLLALAAAALLVYGAWLRFAPDQSPMQEGPLWVLTTTFLKAFVVWTAVFLPTLLMASLLQWPCISTQATTTQATASRKQWLAWDLQTECGDQSDLDQSSYLFAFFFLSIAAMGPVTWVCLISMAHVFPPRMLSFLVGGYKEGSKYWEVVVLSRRSLDIMIIVLMPLSYAAFSQTLATAGLMALALTLHTFVWPYEDPMLNLLEFINLLINTISIILTAYVSGNSWSQTPGLKVAASCAVIALLVGTGATLLMFFLLSLLRRKDGDGPDPQC